MNKPKKGNAVNGWIILDKDIGITSTQVLGKVRHILNARKAGHAGTLDPLATGVLPLAFGEATKTVPFMQNAKKSYTFTITFGAETNTDDLEGEITNTSPARPDKETLLNVLANYTGEIEQTPPQFSAVKIDGERAHKLARQGKDVKIEPRSVYVYSLNLLSFDGETAGLECDCSKGTYIRSLARDIGRDLGCFGHISQLRRTAVGFFGEKQAISLDELQKMVQDAPIEDFLLPVEAPLDDIPALNLTDSEAFRLRNGRSVMLFSKDGQSRMHAAGLDLKNDNGTVLARTGNKPVALVSLKGVKMKPVRVLNV